MTYYLGIDGGGTKTKFTLTDEKLNIIAEHTGPACHYLQIGFDGLTRLLAEGLAKVCKYAACSPSDITYAFVGTAGYGDVAADDIKIRAAVDAGLGNVPHVCGNDCENALAGALGGKPGINIIAGTGSLGCGVNEQGETLRCGGWHHAIGGDEGSGYWIGLQLMRAFERQSDGRDPRTELHEALRSQLALATDDELVTRVVEEWKLDRTKIASLAPLASRLAAAGDPVCIGILHDAAEELADIAIAIYEQLGFADNGEPLPCSGTGGIFKIGAAVTDTFAERIAEHNMKYTRPKFEPDLGAVLLARSNNEMKNGRS